MPTRRSLFSAVASAERLSVSLELLRAAPGCSCWTNRPGGSTRPARRALWSSSGTWLARARIRRLHDPSDGQRPGSTRWLSSASAMRRAGSRTSDHPMASSRTSSVEGTQTSTKYSIRVAFAPVETTGRLSSIDSALAVLDTTGMCHWCRTPQTLAGYGGYPCHASGWHRPVVRELGCRHHVEPVPARGRVCLPARPPRPGAGPGSAGPASPPGPARLLDALRCWRALLVALLLRGDRDLARF